MKKKSYLRFFVKHLIPWVLAAAIASFFIMYMIASPSSSYTTYTASYTTGSLVEMLERGDRPQKDIITLSEISNTLDSAYILYDNKTNAIVCDSSAAVHPGRMFLRLRQSGGQNQRMYRQSSRLSSGVFHRVHPGFQFRLKLCCR